MADFLQDEIRRLLSGVNNPGPMYEGWQNPMNEPTDKGANGVYTTPFDRQGGPEVAQRELEMQAADILSRVLGDGYSKDAIAKVIETLKGTNQSPADHGSAPALQESTQFNYGANLSAPAQNGTPSTMQAEFQAYLAAKKELETKEKERDEDRKERERKEKEDAQMSALAQRLAPVIQTAVASSVDARLSQLGLTLQTGQAQSVPTGDTQQTVPAGISAQGTMGVPANNLAQLPGVQLPANMALGVSSSSNVEGNPNQAKADLFIKEGTAVMSSIQDPFQRGRIKEALFPITAAILSGQTPDISDPALQRIADKAGIQYMNFGLGGAI